MKLTNREVKLKVCLHCPYRNGTQDDPDYHMSFCKNWLPSCTHGRERITGAFSIQETEDSLIISDLGVSIPKKIVNEYINHIVDRLRGRIVDEWEKEKLLWRVQELEETRRDLHLDVKRVIRADPFAVDTETVVLETLIEAYVETRARRFA